MMAPSQALRPRRRVAAAALPCTGPSQQLAEFQIAEATPASPIQAPSTQFALLHEMPDVAETKNVCNQARSLRRNLLPRLEAFRSAKCEMAADPPFPLLFPAIAKVREALLRHAREASQIRGYANIHPAFEHALPP